MQRHSLRLSEGHNIIYATAGNPQNPALILIHGWSSHLGLWRNIIECLQSDYYCVALDLLGFGDSDKPLEGDYEIKAQAERVLELADFLKLQTFSLVGHSMGGQISFLLASELAPQRVQKIVGISALITGQLSPWVKSVIVPLSWVGFYFPATYALWRFLSQWQWFCSFEYSAWFYDWRRLDFAEWATERYMTNQPQIHIGNFRAAQAMHNLNLSSKLADVKAPTLNIFGRQDALVPVVNGELIQKHVPNCQSIWLNECGHFPMLEQPQQIIPALQTFLNS